MANATQNTYPVLPTHDGVIFPEMVVTVKLDSPDAKSLLDSNYEGKILLVPKLDDQLGTVGVLATVEDSTKDRRGGVTATLRAEKRARIGAGVIGDTDALWVSVEEIEPAQPTTATPELAKQYRSIVKDLLEKVGGRRMSSFIPPIDKPEQLADSLAYWPDLSNENRVALLETIDIDERLKLAISLAREASVEYDVRSKIDSDVSEDFNKAQREAILRKQLEAVQAELGEINGGGDVISDYRRQLAELRNPEESSLKVADEVIKAIEKEIDRLERTGTESMEAGWIRTWLDTVFLVPWLTRSADEIDLDRAKSILDADHTGLDKVKERLIEHLAVRRLVAQRKTEAETGEVEAVAREDAAKGPGKEKWKAQRTERLKEKRGAILALVGPPGVGKTSLGRSVADALGRPFVRMALGGVRDEAEIRGHRRTYVGARPGRLAMALIEAGAMNPVIMLDEIDKVGSGWQGDPSAALLEVLDPAQNSTFRDHYFEFELDLSEVMFVATANTFDTIPGPLLDRLEIITIEGYSEAEKATIAKNHLVEKLVESNGLRQGEVTITDDAISQIAADYTRDAGVRNLERQLDKAIRKSATKIATEELDAPVEITPDQLRDLLGRPVPREETNDRLDRPGIATGLAVTGAGGDVLFVETALVDKLSSEGSEPILTGQLGDVMKESAIIVRTLVMERLGAAQDESGSDLGFPDGKRLHVHFPAGAIPKDGPSAGVTMTTALMSLMTNRLVRDDVAMTGEVTLGGRVLPIGGVKQKVLAAHRAGIKNVILPKANEMDADDIPEEVLEEVELHFVTDVDQVLALALSNDVSANEAH